MAVKFGDQATVTKLTEQFDRYFDPATSRMKPGAASPPPTTILYAPTVLFFCEFVTRRTGLDPNLRESVFFAAATTPQRYPNVSHATSRSLQLKHALFGIQRAMILFCFV
jgi:hypothetical protein